MRILHTVLHSSCTKFTFPPTVLRVPFPPHPYHLLSFLLAILTGVRWYLIVVLIFISLMISDVFSCACWPLYIFFGKNVCSGPLPILKSGLFLFLLLSSVSSLYILDISLLSYISFANIFPLLAGGLFVLLIVSFAV